MKTIFNHLSLTIPASDNDFLAILNTYNNQINSLKNTYPNLTIHNILFAKDNGNYFCFLPNNATIGNDFNYCYLTNWGGNGTSTTPNSFNSYALYYFVSWSGDLNNIEGANIQSPSYYYINSGGTLYTYISPIHGKNLSTKPNVISGEFIYTPFLTTTYIANPVYMHTEEGYGTKFLSNVIDLGRELPVEPTPTPTPIPTPVVTSSPGSTDLSQINDSIEGVNSSVQEVNSSVQELINQQSGDTQALISSIVSVPSVDDFSDISSGDIISSLHFEETVDPYENFWSSIVTGLQNALTCSNVQSVTLDFLGTEYVLSVSDFDADYPTPLKNLLTISCTMGIVFAELKMWRKIVIAINTGNLLNLNNHMAKNDISDLF